MKIRWSRGARNDLLSLFSSWAEDDPAGAVELKERLRAAVSELRENPEIGRIAPEFDDPDIRGGVVSPFRIVYRTHNDIQILALQYLSPAHPSFVDEARD